MISRELYESKIYIAAKAEDEELMYRYNVDKEGANLIRVSSLIVCLPSSQLFVYIFDLLLL